jgi:polysaccharide export outer membrane protein
MLLARAAKLHASVLFALALLSPLCPFAAQPQFTNLPLAPKSATNSPTLTPAIASQTNATHSATNQLDSLGSPGTNTLSATSTNAMDALDDKHKLAIGDRLSFRIVEDEEDPKQLFVTDSGDLEVPYIGRFPAENKTCKQLALDLKKELEKEYYFQATVIVAVDLMTKSRGKVYLVGPVRAPGPQDIPSDETFTISKAILRAGGFGDYADKKNVKLTRKDKGGSDRTFIVNVAEILEKGKTDDDKVLEPGDFIYIPERSIRF